MGLSASQARFLQLTARRGDIEYEVQQINFQRLALSEQMTLASTKYQNAVNNRKLTYSFNNGEGVREVDISYNNYKNYMNVTTGTGQPPYYLVSSSGNMLVVQSEDERDEIIAKNTDSIPIAEIQAAKDKVAAYEAYLKRQEEAQTPTPEASATPDPNASATPDPNASATPDPDASATPTADPTETPAEEAPPKPSPEDYRYNEFDIENYDPSGVYVIQKFTVSDFLIAEDLNDTSAFQEALRNGIYYFATLEEDKENNKTKFNIKGLDTLGAGAISDVFDKSDDAAAQAEYDLTQSKIQSMDKKLELKLDQLETERNAIQTEMDSVKKVIEDNIEKSFNIFS